MQRWDSRRRSGDSLHPQAPSKLTYTARLNSNNILENWPIPAIMLNRSDEDFISSFSHPIRNTLHSTQESTKIKNEIFITAFVTEHLWNITPQSSYKYWMCLGDSILLLVEHVLREEGIMDIQYQCHSRSETSKNIRLQLR